MRITLDVAPAVAVALVKLEERTGIPRSSLHQEAIRRGIQWLDEPRTPFVQETLSAGPARLENLDDIGGILTWLDQET